MSKTDRSVHEQLVEIQAKLNAPKSQRNTFGNYNYRSCEDILSAVKPLLGNCVVTLTDELVHFATCSSPSPIELVDSKGATYTEVIGGDRFYVKATATVTDGKESVSVSAYAREAENKKGMDESQITGSASSYARKYALNGLFAIDDVKDADTQDNSASKKARTSSGNREAVQAQNAKTITQMGVSPKDVEDSLKGNPENLPWEGDTPPCDVCGQPTTHKTGTSAKGRDWEALFCTSGDKSHAKWL